MGQVASLCVGVLHLHCSSDLGALSEILGDEALVIWRSQAQRRARRELPSEADAEDAVQIAIQSVLSDLKGGKQIRSAGYLWGALPFAVAKVKRSLSRRLPGTRAEPIAYSDPSAPVIDEEMREAFERAVNALSPNFREVFLLRHYSGLSYAEIAATLGIPLGTVSKWLYEARKRLMEDLRDLL